MRSSLGGVHGEGGRHISGAERIVSEKALDKEILAMVHRARKHDRGSADFIQIKLEQVKEKDIKYCPLIDFYQIDVTTKEKGRQVARRELFRAGVSEKAIHRGFFLLENLCDSMHGAMVIDAVTGERLDDRCHRGVRCSRMDVADAERYEAKMVAEGHVGEHAREAMVLASKVMSAKETVAELCWSDDPNYVAGYVSSKKFGYGRITVMKNRGDSVGGRIFFVEKGTDIVAYDDYLQNQVVLVEMKNEDGRYTTSVESD